MSEEGPSVENGELMKILNSGLFNSPELRRASIALSLVIWIVLVLTALVLPWNALIMLAVFGLLATSWSIFLYFRASLRRQHSIENAVEQLERNLATILSELRESAGKSSYQFDGAVDLVQVLDARKDFVQGDVASSSHNQNERSVIVEIHTLLGMISRGKVLIICPSHEVANGVRAVRNYSKLLECEVRAYDQLTTLFEIGQYSGVILMLPVDLETRAPVIPFSWISRGAKIFVIGGDDSLAEDLESMAFGPRVKFGSIRISDDVRQLSILRDTGY